MGPIASGIEKKVKESLNPAVFQLVNDSASHAGHYQGDGESHFSMLVVSEHFAGKNPVARHRLVYDLVNEEMKAGLHALAIKAYTPEEYEKNIQK